jgi:hypothetical protein
MKGFSAVIFWLFIISIPYCISCSNNDSNPKKRSNIKVIIDTSINFYLDSIFISSKSSRNSYVKSSGEGRHYYGYDHDVYKFDSVENGRLTIRLQSKLDGIISKEIILKSDTTIFFSKKDIPSFQKGDIDSLDFASVKPGEKISIRVSNNGCFHSSIQKIIILREDDQYLVNFFSTQPVSTQKEKNQITIKLNASFKDSLLDFQESLIKFAKQNYLDGCTSSSSYDIQKGNTVYNIYDGTCFGEINYNKILRMINPKWFELYRQ